MPIIGGIDGFSYTCVCKMNESFRIRIKFDFTAILIVHYVSPNNLKNISSSVTVPYFSSFNEPTGVVVFTDVYTFSTRFCSEGTSSVGDTSRFWRRPQKSMYANLIFFNAGFTYTKPTTFLAQRLYSVRVTVPVIPEWN